MVDNNNRPARLITLLKESPLLSSGNFDYDWRVAKRHLFFGADDNQTGQEPWVSDGTVTGTRLIQDLWSGLNAEGVPNSSNPRFVGTWGTQMLFTTQPASGSTGPDRKLWVSDGTAQGTRDIGTLNPALSQALNAVGFSGVGLMDEEGQNEGSHFPFVISTANDTQLWQTDGLTASATRLLKRIEHNDLELTNLQLLPSLITPTEELFFFTVTPPASDGQLWRSNGTPEETFLLKSDFVREGYAVGWQNQLHLKARTPEQGIEWWISDGTPIGMVLLKDIYPGAESDSPEFMTGLSDRILALVNAPNGVELWASEGTPATTRRLKHLNDQASFGVVENRWMVNNQKLFFRLNNQEIWVSDGTEQGTQRFAKFDYIHEFTLFKGRIFASVSGPDGRELWVSDGTEAGTQPLIDLFPGSTLLYPGCQATGAFTSECLPPYVEANSSSPSSLTVQGNWLHFLADTNALYRTDGTAAGTQRIQSFRGSSPTIVPLQEKLLILVQDFRSPLQLSS